MFENEGNPRAITVTAELNSYSLRHNSLTLLVSCVTYRVRQGLMEVAWIPDMGVNQTSLSYFTRGWTEKPWSVLDVERRQVLLMEQRPKDSFFKAFSWADDSNLGESWKTTRAGTLDENVRAPQT